MQLRLALGLVQDPTYLGWHYTLRSTDGHIAQHIQTKDVGWHAGNWYVNAKSIGIEHEGFGAQGTWYTEAMYRASAKLVRYLAGNYDIPLDRQHILGHDNVPGTTPATVAGMHWDPGPYWDWAHYFDLLGAPLVAWAPRGDTGLVVINPDFAHNHPGYTGCDSASPAAACPARGSSAVILRTEPREDAPLLADAGLHPDGSPSTMDVSDVGSRVSAGQYYAVAEVRGAWTAIWYRGQQGWFFNPPQAPAARPALGRVVTPKPGLASIPVYGRAYPEAEAYPAGITPQAIVPLQYTLPAGQRYAAGPVLDPEYYWATTFDRATHVVVRGKTRDVQIQFGHRIAFVRLDDVVLTPSRD
jgi:N-acetylmuramoyl-L-alanine amidase-like protein